MYAIRSYYGARGDGQGQDAEDEGERGHQDRAQAKLRAFDCRFEHILPSYNFV